VWQKQEHTAVYAGLNAMMPGISASPPASTIPGASLPTSPIATMRPSWIAPCSVFYRRHTIFIGTTGRVHYYAALMRQSA
jgi:hypothetical protein